MKAILSFAIILILCLATACGDSATSPAETIDSAESALGTGDVAKAVEISNRLYQSADSSSLTWHDYCRLATIYSAAYNADVDAGASMASAIHCYGKALTLNADLAAGFSPDEEYFRDFQAMRHVYDGQMMDDSDIPDHEEYLDEENLNDHDHE